MGMDWEGGINVKKCVDVICGHSGFVFVVVVSNYVNLHNRNYKPYLRTDRYKLPEI